MSSIDKEALRALVLRELERAQRTLRAAAKETHEAATHEEARPENDKDTRGLEASYLARGQAQRVEELEEEANRLRFLSLRAFDPGDPVALSALVTVEIDGVAQLYFLSPVAGGVRVVVEGVGVSLLTPGSPVGRALLDKHAGESFELKLAGRVREYEIVRVE